MNVLEIKAAVRERDGCRCTKCGMTNEEHRAIYHGISLHVHRLEPGSLYTIEGSITVCYRCHGKEPRRKKGQPDLGVKRKGKVINVWLDSLFGEAFERYLDSLDVRPTITRAVEIALKEFLQKRGFWPPSSPSSR